MTLTELLSETKDFSETLPSGAKIVHPGPRSADYFHLEDYRVSSTGSGPVYWMVKVPPCPYCGNLETRCDCDPKS